MKTIHLRGQKNLRDIGGKYQDVEIKLNHLLRGRMLTSLGPKQIETLKVKYHLRTIIDLRDLAEQAQKPDMEIPGVKKLLMPIFADGKVGITHEDREKKDKIEILRKLPPMSQMYYEMFHDECLENLAKIIRFIVTAPEEEYAIYYHCSEGKDRTGVISAVLLSMLGVSQEEIIKEYLYTNRVAHHKANAYYLVAKYVRFDVTLAKKLHGMFSAKKEYIQVYFDMIKNEYGGDYMNFYTKGLGLTKEEIDAFREKLIVK
ncbi:MAG: tyrosine-protein phosphatase [Bacilli bacterium]|nr:tyrosine-protein phosphatase [Bacilli bacterium]